MLVCKLPGSGFAMRGLFTPVFTDHVLFTEKLSRPYAYPSIDPDQRNDPDQDRKILNFFEKKIA